MLFESSAHIAVYVRVSNGRPPFCPRGRFCESPPHKEKRRLPQYGPPENRPDRRARRTTHHIPCTENLFRPRGRTNRRTAGRIRRFSTETAPTTGRFWAPIPDYTASSGIRTGNGAKRPYPTTGLPTGKQPTAAVAHRPCEPAVAGYDSRRYDRYRQKTDLPTPGRGRFRIGKRQKTIAYSLRTRFSTKRPASPTGARHTGRYRNRGYGPARPHIASQRRQGAIDRPARRPDSVRRLPPERP